jgi:potassium-transporting ATPase KdpC subunit
MKNQWLVSARVLALSLVLLGVVYPLVIMVAGRGLFPFRAGGSIIQEGNHVLGSDLIAQDFSRPGYFHPRPSACAYDPRSSAGSNLAPTSARLFELYGERIQQLKSENPQAEGKVPLELVAASSSGLDPHLSLGAALWQLPRVARERQLPEETVMALIRESARAPLFGFIGEWRVNVLELNRRITQLQTTEKAQKND